MSLDIILRLVFGIYDIISIWEGDLMTQQKKTKNQKKLKNTFKITKYIKFFFIALVLGCFLFTGVLTGLVISYVKDEPIRSAEEIQNKISTNNLTGFAYFVNTDEEGNNQLIGTLRADEDRRLIKYDEMPKVFIDAVVAIEDRAFWDHNGVNFVSTGRAFFQQLFNLEVQTGGSTITQQLAKNSFLSLEKTNERKVKEIFLALRIDLLMSKEEIFAAYVNKNPYGKAANLNNVYGIQAASKGYFNKDAKDLNLAESAYLAGLPQRPTAYSAFDSNGFNEDKYQLAISRQQQVLNSMLEEGYINETEYNESLAYNIKEAFAYDTESSQKEAYNTYSYLMLEIEDRATELLLESLDITADTADYDLTFENAKQELLTGGYKVYTTIDKDIYEAMNSVAKNPDNFSNPRTYNFELTNGNTIKIEDALEEVGATLIENKTGAILGFIGGRDFTQSQVNHSNFRGTSDRQPGSSIKPLLDYGPALELGYIQPATPIDDIPLGTAWEPENWNHKYNGRIPAREALNWSYNIPAVKVYGMVGPDTGYEYYTKLGLEVDETFFKQAGLTPAIGSIETSPERMTSAYTTFANGGIYVHSYMIDRIVDNNGNVVYEHKSQPEVVFSEQTSYLMTDMLRTVISSGTGGTVRKYVGYDLDIAGKTGTTNDTKDAWFIGYSPEVTLGVWVGYDYPIKLWDQSIASKTWGSIFAEVLSVKPDISPTKSTFKMPDDLVKMEVSSTSGKLPSDLTREAGYLTTDWFNKQYIPTEIDDSLERARVVYYNDGRYFAKPETPDDMVQTGIFFKRESYVVPEYDPDDEDAFEKSNPVDFDKELPNEEDPRISFGMPPEPPSSIILKSQENQNILSWDKNTDSTIVGYRIYKYSLLSIGFKYVGTTLQKDLKPGRMYYEDKAGSCIYYIVAVNSNGMESSKSEYIGNMDFNPFDNENNDDTGNNDFPLTIPSAPSNVNSIHVASTNYVTLTWSQNDSQEFVIRYNIYFGNDMSGPFTLVANTQDVLYTHNFGEQEGEIYYYITAVNQLGESQHSEIIEIK